MPVVTQEQLDLLLLAKDDQKQVRSYLERLKKDGAAAVSDEDADLEIDFDEVEEDGKNRPSLMQKAREVQTNLKDVASATLKGFVSSLEGKSGSSELGEEGEDSAGKEAKARTDSGDKEPEESHEEDSSMKIADSSSKGPFYPMPGRYVLYSAQWVEEQFMPYITGNRKTNSQTGILENPDKPHFEYPEIFGIPLLRCDATGTRGGCGGYGT